MRFSTSIQTLTIALVMSTLVAACEPTATMSGVVTSSTGGGVGGATIAVGDKRATTNLNGEFELRDLPVGPVTIVTSKTSFETRSEEVSLREGDNRHDVTPTP